MQAETRHLPPLSFEDARHVVEEHAASLHPRGKVLTSLLSSIGLVLAEPIFADRDFPPFRRAARDGYALRASDLHTMPAKLEVVDEIRAGANNTDCSIEPGQAASIMTGAAAPIGADAIVMIEHTSRSENWIEVKKAVTPGENIVPLGSEAKRGGRLLAPGTRLDFAAIALAATVGKIHLLVYPKPRVAVLATGDEIVDIASQPGPNQIRNSNTYSLGAQIQAAGAEAVLLPLAPDESVRLKELIVDGFEADLLLIAGGVSMGKYDLVESVLADLDAKCFFTGVNIQPGRPVVFGRTPKKYFLGLPGNPVSTMVTFELFARPLIEALAGMVPEKLTFLYAKLKKDIHTKTGLKRFLPGLFSGEFERAEVELIHWHGSADIASLARSNCYVVVPSDRSTITAGEWVPVLLR